VGRSGPDGAQGAAGGTGQQHPVVDDGENVDDAVRRYPVQHDVPGRADAPLRSDAAASQAGVVRADFRMAWQVCRPRPVRPFTDSLESGEKQPIIPAGGISAVALRTFQKNAPDLLGRCGA
jgi:hypothetical protein